MPTGERPAVDCVLAAYNGEAYLEQAVVSVLGQKGWDIRVIAVDDASTDATPALLARLAAADPRITVILQARNMGPGAARNRALDVSEAPLVGFIDQDDTWTGDRLDVAWQALRDDPSLDFVMAHQRLRNMSQERPRWVRQHWLDAPQPAYTLGTMLGWRARTFDAIGRLDESLRMGNDTDWFVRARDRGLKSRMLPDVLMDRRIHDSNDSKNVRQSAKDLFALLRRRTMTAPDE